MRSSPAALPGRFGLCENHQEIAVIAIYQYQVTNNGIQPVEETTFAAAGLKEREHLQDLLKRNIHVIAPDTLILAEEFGYWDDSPTVVGESTYSASMKMPVWW